MSRIKLGQSHEEELFAADFQPDDFPGFGLGLHLEGTAANLAIRRKPLGRDAGINGQRETLTAKRAGYGFSNFHRSKYLTLYPRSEKS